MAEEFVHMIGLNPDEGADTDSFEQSEQEVEAF